MRKLVFWACFILQGSVAFGQLWSDRIDVLAGMERVMPFQTEFLEIIAYESGEIHVLKEVKHGSFGERSTFILERYTGSLHLINSEVVFEQRLNQSKSFEFIVKFGKQFYLFTSFINFKDQAKTYYMQSIDSKSLVVNEDVLVVAHYQQVNIHDPRIRLNYAISEDASKLLVYHQIPGAEQDAVRYKIMVIDRDYQLLQEREEELNFPEYEIVSTQFEVSNTGEVFLLLNRQQSANSYKFIPEYYLYSFSGEGDSRMLDLLFYDRRISNLRLNLEENELKCVGMYKDLYSPEIMGTCYFAANYGDDSLSHTKFHPFQESFVLENLPTMKQKKKKRQLERGKAIGLKDYECQEVLNMKNGDLVMICEEQFVQDHTYQKIGHDGYPISSRSSSFLYKDIMVASFSSAGELNWIQRIPKNQETIDDNGSFSSYMIASNKNSIYFLFNDHPNNLYYSGHRKLEKFSTTKESVLVMVEVDANGNQKKELVYNTKSRGLLARPKVSMQVSENEVLLFSQNRYKHRFTKLTINQPLGSR